MAMYNLLKVNEKMHLNIWSLSSEHLGETNSRLSVANSLANLFTASNFRQSAQVNLIDITSISKDYLVHVDCTNLEVITCTGDNRRLSAIRSLAAEAVESFLFNKCVDPPDVIISSWKKDSPLAIAIMEYFSNKTKRPLIIQLGLPHGEVKTFDLIAARKSVCDIVSSHHGNGFEILTVPSPVNRKLLADGQKIWAPVFKSIGHPLICVFLGGDDGGAFEFDVFQAKSMAIKVKKIAILTGGVVAIAGSPRTGKASFNIFLSECGESVVFKYWYNDTSFEKNPFFGMLAYGDILVVTGESLSMVSDICATPQNVDNELDNRGKACLIYRPNGPSVGARIWSTYNRAVFDAGLAIDLTSAIPLLEKNENDFKVLTQRHSKAVTNTGYLVAQKIMKYIQE